MGAVFFFVASLIVYAYAATQPEPQAGPYYGLGGVFIAAAIYCFIRSPDVVFLLGRHLRDAVADRLATSEKPNVPKPRDPAEVATPAETKRAQEHMRVALAYIDDAFKQDDNYLQLHVLSHASMSLAKACSLDPRAAVDGATDNGPPLRYTLDDISAEILYFESILYSKQADASSSNAIRNIGEHKSLVRKYEKDEEKELNLALNAIDKALKYTSTSALYHFQRARVLRGLGKEKESKAAADRALELDPDNIDILKLHTSYDT